jgi:hypothetical protein
VAQEPNSEGGFAHLGFVLDRTPTPSTVLCQSVQASSFADYRGFYNCPIFNPGTEKKSSIIALRERLLPVEVLTDSDSIPSHIYISSFALGIALVPFIIIFILDLPRIIEHLQMARINMAAFKAPTQVEPMPNQANP